MQDESTETVYRKSRATRRSRAPNLDESGNNESSFANITSNGTLINIENTFCLGNSMVPGRVSREPYRDITSSASKNTHNMSTPNPNDSKTSVANSSVSTIFNRTSGKTRINRSHLDNTSGTATVNNTRNETLSSEKTFFNRGNRLNASQAMADSSLDTNMDKSSFHSNFQADELSTTKFVRNNRTEKSNVQSLTNISELEVLNSTENSTPQGDKSGLDATSFQREFHGRKVSSRSALSMNQSNRSATDFTLGHSISTRLSDMNPIFESTKIVSDSREINETRSSVNSIEDDRKHVGKNTQQSVGLTKPGEMTENTEFSKIQLTQNDESMGQTGQLEKTGNSSASDLQNLNSLNPVNNEMSNKVNDETSNRSLRIENMGMEHSEMEFNTFKPSASTNLSDNQGPNSQSYNRSASTQFQRAGRMDLSVNSSSQQASKEISVNFDSNPSDASTKFQRENIAEEEISLQTSNIQNSIAQHKITTEQISELQPSDKPIDHQISVQTTNTSTASTKFHREIRLSQNLSSNSTGPKTSSDRSCSTQFQKNDQVRMKEPDEQTNDPQVSVQTTNTSTSSTKFKREFRLSENMSSNSTGPKTSLDQSCSTQFQKNDKIRMSAPDISNIESCDSTKMFLVDSTVNMSTVTNLIVNDTTGNNTSVKTSVHGEDSFDPYAAENLEKLNETEYETAPEGSDEENEEDESETEDEKSDTLMSSDNDDTNASWRNANSREITKSTVNESQNELQSKSESLDKSQNKSQNTSQNESKNTTLTSKPASIGSEHSNTVSEIIPNEEGLEMIDNNNSETNQSTDFLKSRMFLESSTNSRPSSIKSKEVNQSRMDKTNMGMDFEETEVVTKGGSPKQNLEAGMHNLSVNEENNLDGNESDSSSGSEIDFNNPWSVFEKVDIPVDVLNEMGSDEIQNVYNLNDGR